MRLIDILPRAFVFFPVFAALGCAADHSDGATAESGNQALTTSQLSRGGCFVEASGSCSGHTGPFLDPTATTLAACSNRRATWRSKCGAVDVSWYVKTNDDKFYFPQEIWHPDGTQEIAACLTYYARPQNGHVTTTLSGAYSTFQDVKNACYAKTKACAGTHGTCDEQLVDAFGDEVYRLHNVTK